MTPEEKRIKHAQYMKTYFHRRKAKDPTYSQDINRRSRKLYAKDKQSRISWLTTYHQAHPFASAVYNANWLAKRTGIPGKLLLPEVERRMAEMGGCCFYCQTMENVGIDHIEPFAKGGHNILENIVPCCRSCNSSKRANTEPGTKEYALDNLPTHRQRKQRSYITDTHKQCKTCGEVKNKSEFRRLYSRPGFNEHDAHCKPCRLEKVRAKHAALRHIHEISQ